MLAQLVQNMSLTQRTSLLSLQRDITAAGGAPHLPEVGLTTRSPQTQAHSPCLTHVRPRNAIMHGTSLSHGIAHRWSMQQIWEVDLRSVCGSRHSSSSARNLRSEWACTHEVGGGTNSKMGAKRVESECEAGASRAHRIGARRQLVAHAADAMAGGGAARGRLRLTCSTSARGSMAYR